MLQRGGCGSQNLTQDHEQCGREELQGNTHKRKTKQRWQQPNVAHKLRVPQPGRIERPKSPPHPPPVRSFSWWPLRHCWVFSHRAPA
jgi:hypothetical protein